MTNPTGSKIWRSASYAKLYYYYFYFFSKESTNYRSKNSINKGEHSWLTSRVNLNIRSFSHYIFCN